MSEEETFRDLIHRARAGDQMAAEDLVRQYEPEIRRVIRVRGQNPQVQAVFDSMDICQSVLGNFFVRLAVGQFELETPEQLIALLVRMAKNKLVDKVRSEEAEKRPKVVGSQEQLHQVADHVSSPSQIVTTEELKQAVRSRLTPKVRYVVEQRELGREWADLAGELGCGAEALRKRVERALDQAADALHLHSLWFK